MKQEARVIMLPTKDKTPLFKDGHEIIYYPAKNIEFTDVIYQHLYITVSQEVEPIKEGDWAIVTNTAGTEFICKYHNESKWEILGKNNGFITTITGDSRKIIATTDKLKIDNWVGYYNSDESYLPQIPQQFIKEYCDKGSIDKVMVEYDTMWKNKGKNRLQPFPDSTTIDRRHILKLNQDNTIIIHPLEKKMYSGTDLLGYHKDSFDSFLLHSSKYSQEDRELIIDALHGWLEKDNL